MLWLLNFQLRYFIIYIQDVFKDIRSWILTSISSYHPDRRSEKIANITYIMIELLNIDFICKVKFPYFCELLSKLDTSLINILFYSSIKSLKCI